MNDDVTFFRCRALKPDFRIEAQHIAGPNYFLRATWDRDRKVCVPGARIGSYKGFVLNSDNIQKGDSEYAPRMKLIASCLKMIRAQIFAEELKRLARVRTRRFSKAKRR